MRFPLALATLAVAGFATISCGGGFVDPAQNVTDTFTGTVEKSRFEFKPFDVGQNGEYFITLVSLNPPLGASLTTQITLVPQASGSCFLGTVIAQTNFAVAGKQALNGVINKGSYCVGFGDVFGNFSGPTSYVLTVNHP